MISKMDGAMSTYDAARLKMLLVRTSVRAVLLAVADYCDERAIETDNNRVSLTSAESDIWAGEARRIAELAHDILH